MRFSRQLHGYVLPLAVFLTVLLDWGQVFTPAGRWLYEHAAHVAYDLRWHSQANQAGAYNDAPLLIEIDDASIQTLGRWPWARANHAKLLNTLNAADNLPSIVAFDVLFTEPQTTSDAGADLDSDVQFAQAIAKAARRFPVILASQVDSEAGHSTLLRPKAPIADSGAKLAAIQLDPDSDGAVRRYQAHNTALSDLRLPYLGYALFNPSSAVAFPSLQSLRLQVTASAQTIADGKQPTPTWFYPLPSDWIVAVSYDAVLSGAVPPKLWRGRPVLIAATANGLGDRYVSHIKSSKQVIAGGELVLGALHTEKMLALGLPVLRSVGSVWQWLCVVLFSGAVLFAATTRLRISGQFWVMAVCLSAIATWVIFMLAVVGVWINPMPMACASLLTWLLWMSSTMQRLIQHLLERLAVLRKTNAALHPPAFDPLTLARTESHTVFQLPRHSIEKTVQVLSDLEHMNDKEFDRLNQIVDLLPDAAFVLVGDKRAPIKASTHRASSVDGVPLFPAAYGLKLLLSNQAAQQMIRMDSGIQRALTVSPMTLADMLSRFQANLTQSQTKRYQHFLSKNTAPAQATAQANVQSAAQTTTQIGSQTAAQTGMQTGTQASVQTSIQATLQDNAPFDWNALLALHMRSSFSHGVEASTLDGKRFLIKWVALKHRSPDETEQTYILSVVDLSVSMALAQTREDTLNFLSHDIRSPQATIMALLDLEASQHTQLKPMFEKIRFQAQRTLDLSESFVQWSQASHTPAYHWVDYNLNALVIEALDEQWANAKQRGIVLHGDTAAGEVALDLWVSIDRTLMWRALVNLISNAMKACQTGDTIVLSAKRDGNHAVLAVVDNGPGIPLAQQSSVFKAFVQGSGLKRHGAGLGLAFVKAVVDQHRGQIVLHSPAPLLDGLDQPLKGVGTRFEIRLPLLDNQSPPACMT